MRFKGTAALLVVFAILGAFVYFSEVRGKDERQKQEEAKKKAVNIDQNDVVEISLVYPDLTITGVKKGEKQWEITNPAGVEADPDEWDSLASNISRIERQNTVTSQPGDLSQFGLQNPSVKIITKTKNGKTIDLAMGSENPRKTFNYAKFSDSNDVFLTPTSSAGMFKKTLMDLRNKKVLEFEPDDIDAVRIADKRNELEFQKNGSDWSVKKPSETKADNSEVTSFVSSVRYARASSFPESTVDAKTAGLQPAVTRITLHDAKAKTDRVLLVGNSPEKDKYYAMDASRPTILIIDKDIPEKARRPLGDWRDKSITQLQRDKIEEIEIQHGSDKFTIKKADTDWKLDDGRKLQFDKVSGLLSALDFEKAKSIIDAPGPLAQYALDKPKLEVIFRQGANELLRLAFGGDSKNPEGIYIKTSDSVSVKIAGKDVYDKFNVKAEDLVEAAKTSQ